MKNVEVAQKYLKAVYSGDVDTAKSMLAPMIKLTIRGNNELSGNYESIENFFAAFGKMMELANNTYRMDEQIEWLEGEKRAVLFALESAEKDGKRHQFHRVIDYKIDGNEILEIRIYEGDPHVVDNVFST